jgi:hypothetical protein
MDQCLRVIHAKKRAAGGLFQKAPTALFLRIVDTIISQSAKTGVMFLNEVISSPFPLNQQACYGDSYGGNLSEPCFKQETISYVCQSPSYAHPINAKLPPVNT